MTPFEAVETPEGYPDRKVQFYLNDKYQVIKSDALESGMQAKDWPAMWWLSIKRIDKECIHDWRELQKIKNELIGPENEAVELYPAESRLIDESNQFHLWVLKEVRTNVGFPFGWSDRSVETPEEATKHGAKQRLFEDKK